MRKIEVLSLIYTPFSCIFLNIYSFYAYECFACVCIYVLMCVPGVLEGQRRLSDPLGLALQVAEVPRECLCPQEQQQVL